MRYQILERCEIGRERLKLVRSGANFRVVSVELPRGHRVLPLERVAAWSFQDGAVAERAFAWVVAIERYWAAVFAGETRTELGTAVVRAATDFCRVAREHGDPPAMKTLASLLAARLPPTELRPWIEALVHRARESTGA